jgi:DNA-binding NtrC family response regulator
MSALRPELWTGEVSYREISSHPRRRGQSGSSRPDREVLEALRLACGGSKQSREFLPAARAAKAHLILVDVTIQGSEASSLLSELKSELRFSDIPLIGMTTMAQCARKISVSPSDVTAF